MKKGIILFFIFNMGCFNILDSSRITLRCATLEESAPNRRMYEIVFYENDKIFARRIIQNGKVVLVEGELTKNIVVENYSDGRIRHIFIYQKGKLNGKVISFYESGALKVEAVYKNGYPTGIGKRYYENGTIMSEWVIEDGKEVLHKEYFETGQLREEVYRDGDKTIRNEYDVQGQFVQ